MVSYTTRSAEQAPDEQYLREAIGWLNNHRIGRLALILVVIHVAHVAIFWPYVPGASDRTDLWRNGIIVAHAGMLVFTAVIGAAVAVLEQRNKMPRAASGSIPALASLSYLLFGAALAVIDQQVTSSITPLLIACVGVAVTILVPPVVAAFNYAVVLAFFVTAVAWTQSNVEQLLSVRVNSITATGVGFGVALLLWRNQVLALRQQRQIEEQKRELEAKNRELASLATQDALTGLSNRAQFLRDAAREIARMHRTGKKACLIMMDIDHFKLINDTYGHPAGDSILRGISHILTNRLKHIDTLSRFGGEEFAVLLPDCSLEDGVEVADRLRGEIEAHPFRVAGKPVRVTASFGVAALSADYADALNECYHTADKALYQAKGDGRNCVRAG